MKNVKLYLSAGATAGLLAGCSALAPQVPKCSDVETLDLARQIIIDSMSELGKITLTTEQLRTVLPIGMPHATKLEENIKKYSCQATLELPVDQSTVYRIPIEYTSQLDDSDQHLVYVTGIEEQHALALYGSVAEAMQKGRTGASVNTSSPAPASGFSAIGQSSAEQPAVGDQSTLEDAQAERDAYFAGTGHRGTPRFSDFALNAVYQGPKAQLDMSTETAQTYRTRLNEAIQDGQVEMGGELTTAVWGCGTGCAFTTFINLRTGAVVEEGFGGEYGERIVAMRPDSALVITEGPEVDDDYNQKGYFAFYHQFTGNGFKLLQKVPIAEEQY